jgi:hypothetical protein
MKLKIHLCLCLIVVLFASCKKELPHYSISDDMKQMFAYQQGSYWIYQNDSTDLFDSTYVNSCYSNTHDNFYPGMTREIIAMYFKSQFLSDFEIGYFCPGQNCLTIARKVINSNDTLQHEIQGPIAYFAGWEPNMKIYSQNCLGDCIFTYRIIPKDTVNNNIYSNIICSKMISIDSINNPEFYFREIYFVKNIGIIKYVENIKYYNIQRSWSLRRYKVIQ